MFVYMQYKCCYIFEDHPDDCLSKMLLKCFILDDYHKVVFSKGNGGIKNIAQQHLKEGFRVYAFLDTVPGNKSITDKYYQLLDIQRDNYNFVLIPIVCAEYYLLRSLHSWQFGINTEILRICTNKEVYFYDPVAHISKPTDNEPSCKTFEKMCKGIINRYGNWCLRKEKGPDTTRYEEMNNSLKKFYEEDCRCCIARDNCERCSIIEKLERIVKEYPIFPSCSLFTISKLNLSRNELLSVCDALVTEYNSFSAMLREAAPERDKNFYEQLILPTTYIKR